MDGTIVVNTAQGAIQGGVTGASYGGLPGAIVGAIVGGTIGAFGGGKASSAKKAAKRAAWIQQRRERNAEDAQYLAMIRQARLARSGSLAASASYGISTSSLATSALSSIGSQSQYSVQYTANDERLLAKYKFYAKKAGKYAKASQNILAAGRLGSTAASVYGAYSNAGTAAEQTAESFGSIGPYTQWQQTAIDRSYDSALQSGLNNAALLNNFMNPIYSGVNRYNQI